MGLLTSGSPAPGGCFRKGSESSLVIRWQAHVNQFKYIDVGLGGVRHSPSLSDKQDHICSGSHQCLNSWDENLIITPSAMSSSWLLHSQFIQKTKAEYWVTWPVTDRLWIQSKAQISLLLKNALYWQREGDEEGRNERRKIRPTNWEEEREVKNVEEGWMEKNSFYEKWHNLLVLFFSGGYTWQYLELTQALH